MSKGKGKEREQQLTGNVDKAIADVKTTNPFQQAIDAQSMKTLDWENRTGEFAGQSKNILDLPGMDGALDIYGNAQELADQERSGGQGAGAFSDTANGAYGEHIKQQRDFELYDRRAKGLSDAAGATIARAHGQADTSINRDMARKSQVAQLSQGTLNSYINRPRSTPWWQVALGGLSQVGAAYAGKP